MIGTDSTENYLYLATSTAGRTQLEMKDFNSSSVRKMYVDEWYNVEFT